MESFLYYFGLFSLLLFASTIDARKDPSEYWKGVMQDQQMPEALQGLVVHAHPASNNINKGQLVKNSENKEDQKPCAEDFEPKPNLSVYHDGIKPTAEEDKSFPKDFEPKPVSVYPDDVRPKNGVSFAKDFEPRPSASAYHE